MTALHLRTSGTRILDRDGRPFRLKSVSWYGANEDTFVPHGLWAVNWRDALRSMAGMGFNSLRLPFSGAFALRPDRMPRANPPCIDFARNPDLRGRTAHQIFRMILDDCAALGLRVILDMHQRSESSGIDGDPVGDGTLQGWIDQWLAMARHFGGHPAVIGMDVYNEPHKLTWDVWADHVEACTIQVHAVAPHWLAFVQGPGEYEGTFHWWGGNLRGVAARPIELRQPGRLVYAPHEYGHSGGPQPWLPTGTRRVAGYPGTLPGLFREAWGFILERGIAPVWVGEYGGSFGIDETGRANPAALPDGAAERAWLGEFTRYVNRLGVGHAYWCWNGGGGQPFGLMTADWRPQTAKLALLAPLLA